MQSIVSGKQPHKKGQRDNFMDDPTWIEHAATRWAAFVGALSTLIFFFRRVIMAVGSWMRDFGRMPATVQRNECKADAALELATEASNMLKKNGGNSVIDKLDRIEGLVLRTDGMVWLGHEMASKPTFVTDAYGQVTEVNHAYVKQFGHTAEDMRDNRWVAFVHEDSREYAVEQWRHTVADKREADFSYKHRDGYTVRLRAYPIVQSDGEVSGWLGHSIIEQPDA